MKNCNATSNNTFHVKEALTVGSSWSIDATVGVEFAQITASYSQSQQLQLEQSVDINVEVNQTVFSFISFDQLIGYSQG